MSRWRQRRASAFSECFAEAVGLFIAETRERAHRLMSARLESPSRNLEAARKRCFYVLQMLVGGCSRRR